MPDVKINTVKLLLLVTPYFNIAATTAFLDPFRAANYLLGQSRFRWTILSSNGGDLPSSSGITIKTEGLGEHLAAKPDLVLVSSSWTPEGNYSDAVTAALQKWARAGTIIGGLDTGAFILARAGLLKGKSAAVHYEHIDALIETAPEVDVSEDLIVMDDGVFTCCGGTASVDLGLYLLRIYCGTSVANSVARYLFHHDIRGLGRSQNPKQIEPTGHLTPGAVRKAIDLMETHLEEPMTIPQICAELSVSQRQLSRLFVEYVRKSPVEYYRDIRLDRARGLVTQTEMKLSEVSAACGFNSQVHFSRSYRQRFGLPPSRDRIEGRVPFEFRAWPMYDPKPG